MNKIYIGNLPYKISASDLEELFHEYDIVDINLIKDRETGRLKGFGFVEFKTPEQVQEALKLNGQDFHGRALKISVAQEKRSGDFGGKRGRN
jgi:cold-inducible RNA-binding protein